MIEVSQWRASIGLWNCCCSGTKQKLCQDEKKIKQSRCISDVHLDKGFKLSKLSFFVKFLTALLKSIFAIELKLFFCSLLLLLSGDVELNPGPVIDERPDIAVLLDLLEPLENWQSFGCQLPGITQQIIEMIQKFEMSSKQQKKALLEKWFEQNPKATWKDVLAALKRRKETKLIENIKDHLASDLFELKDNPGPIAPKEILRSYSDKLTAAIADNLHTISSALYANRLMSLNVKSFILSTTGNSDYEKASYLVTTLLRQIEASLDPQKDLINICHILINQKHQTLSDIATSILDQLGQPYKVNSLDPLDDVQKYINILKEKYLSQPIIASDWPPRVGNNFFGRLTLVRENNFTSQAEHKKYSWCMLRGHIDEISYIQGYKVITIKTMLNPDLLSLRVAIDGPPGIGKTTLCRKLLNMWSKGSHELQHYDLVLYCPFRHKAVAEATKLADLFVYESPKVSKVVDWITEREGKGLLIIFDGWDELSIQLRESSLATKIICRDQLVRSSVIVTSRTYATASLLQLECLNQNIHVIGFFANEINKVIKGTLSQELAKKLIEDLQFRSDVLSLCYVPLVCSMAILVYQKSGGHLPTTMSELYENFILQTIRRHIKKTSNDLKPQSLDSLSNLPSNLNLSLQQLGKFAYLSLHKETSKMTFTHSQLQSLDDATKENYLGLITTITDFDQEWYQFIHFSIQEFLAAWWIAKSEKTEEIFKNCFEDGHFRLCLRFVAGLTKLQHDSYQQYFNSTLFDLQCKRCLFEIESCHPWVTPDKNHADLRFRSMLTFRIKFCTLLHLLYESQNTELCHILAQCIKNHSICLGNISPNTEQHCQQPFDTLCFTYFIHNTTNTCWNYLHFHSNFGNQWNYINKKLEKSTPAQSKTVVIDSFWPKSEFVQWPRYFNVQELVGMIDDRISGLQEFNVFLIFFSKLPQLKNLHLQVSFLTSQATTTHLLELEKSIANSQLQELCLGIHHLELENISITSDITASLFKGVTRSKTIKSFKIKVKVSHNNCLPLPDGTVENLLLNNKTLQELSLNLPHQFISSTLNIKGINMPLNALEINKSFEILEKPRQCKIMLALLPHTKGLKNLKLMLYNLYPPYPLLLSNPNLQYLSLQLQTFENVIELFDSLTNNTTLLGLKVGIQAQNCLSFGSTLTFILARIGKSFENLLTQNKILQHLEVMQLQICTPFTIPLNNALKINQQPMGLSNFPSLFLHFLNKGLAHNMSLKHLTVPIEALDNEEVKLFLDTLSQKNIFIELQLDMYSVAHTFLSEDGLPHFTNVIHSVRTLKILCVKFKFQRFDQHLNLSQELSLIVPRITTNAYHFLHAIIFHPSLEYVHLEVSTYLSIFKEQLKRVIKTYEEQEQKPLSHIELFIK